MFSSAVLVTRDGPEYGVTHGAALKDPRSVSIASVVPDLEEAALLDQRGSLRR